MIYEITCKSTGERYIGITRAKGRAFQKTAKDRLKLHFCQAKEENRNGLLQQRIEEYGPKSFIVKVLEVVRGRKAGTAKEKVLIKERLDPTFDMNEQSLRRRKHRRDKYLLTA